MRGLVRIAALISLVAAMSACSDDALPSIPPDATQLPLSTASWEPGDDAALVGLQGRIALSPDDCVYITDGYGGSTNVIWPHGYTAELDPEGHLLLRNESGEPVAKEGTEIDGGGGFVGPRGSDAETVCRVPGGGPFFSVMYAVPPLSP